MNYIQYLQGHVKDQILPSRVSLVVYLLDKQYPLGTPPYISCLPKQSKEKRKIRTFGINNLKLYQFSVLRKKISKGELKIMYLCKLIDGK